MSVRRTRAAVWTLADQIVSSATNFAVAAGAIALLSTAEYALFSVTIVVVLSVLAVVRSAFIESAVIVPDPTGDPWSVAVRRVLAWTVPVGLVGVVAVIAGSSGSSGWQVVGVAMLAFPGLALVETFRYRAFARGRAWVALALDTGWGVGALASVLVVWRLDAASAATLTVAWLAPVSALGWVVLVAGDDAVVVRRPQLHDVNRSSLLVVDTTLELVWAVLVFASVAVVAGSELVAALGAVRVLLGPATVIGLAVAPMYALRRASGDVRPSWRSVAVPAGLVLAVAVVIVGVVLALGARRIEEVGDSAAAAFEFVVPLAVFVTSSILLQVGRQQIRYFGLRRRLLVLRAASVAVLAVGILVAVAVGGNDAVAGALAVVGAVTAMWWLRASVAGSGAEARADDLQPERDGSMTGSAK